MAGWSVCIAIVWRGACAQAHQSFTLEIAFVCHADVTGRDITTKTTKEFSVHCVFRAPALAVVAAHLPYHISSRVGGRACKTEAVDSCSNYCTIRERSNSCIAITLPVVAVFTTLRTLENHHIIAPSLTIVRRAARNHVNAVGHIMDVHFAGIAQCHKRTVGSTGDSRNTIVSWVFFRGSKIFVAWCIKQFELRHKHTATTFARVVVHGVDGFIRHLVNHTTHTSVVALCATNQWQILQATNFFSASHVGYKVNHIFACRELQVAGESGLFAGSWHFMSSSEEKGTAVLFRVAVVENVSEGIFKRCITAIRKVVLIFIALTGIHADCTEVASVSKQAVSEGWNIVGTYTYASHSQHLILVAQADIAHFLVAGIGLPSLQLIVNSSSIVASWARSFLSHLIKIPPWCVVVW